MSANRAKTTGRRLTEEDAALAKAMILRGDPLHDIASWFGVNPGRISEINTGKRFADVQPAANAELPPPGPYGREEAA